jgi:hypothetical protein
MPLATERAVIRLRRSSLLSRFVPRDRHGDADGMPNVSYIK